MAEFEFSYENALAEQEAAERRRQEEAAQQQNLLGTYGGVQIGNQIYDLFGTGAEAPGSLGVGGPLGQFGFGEGGYSGPLAGAAGLYNLYKSKRGGTVGGVAQGALSGVAAGSYFGPPGMIVGGILGTGMGLFGKGKPKTKEEERWRKDLASQGIMVENPDVKEWEANTKFAQSRKEEDLLGHDIANAAQLYQRYGPGYAKLDRATKDLIAQEALNRKLVRERLGRIEIGSSADLDKFAQEKISSFVPPEVAQEEARAQGESRRARQEYASQAKKQRAQEALNQLYQFAPSPKTVAPIKFEMRNTYG